MFCLKLSKRTREPEEFCKNLSWLIVDEEFRSLSVGGMKLNLSPGGPGWIVGNVGTMFFFLKEEECVE